MEPELRTNNDGPMDRTVENNTGNQSGESCQPRNSQPVPKEEEPHQNHSFEWCLSGKTPTLLTCNKAGTVEDSLKRSARFRKIAAKNENKELVIVRDGKAISSHFPCRLIKNERLTVRYVKAAGSFHPRRKRPSGKPVIFHVLVRGGTNVVKIMRNPALQTIVQEVTVYAYEGEKVKEALKRDGRFRDIIFSRNCALSNTCTEVKIEMSNLVDDLDGTHKIVLIDKSAPPESLPGSLDDACLMSDESQRGHGDEIKDPSPQSTATNAPKKEPKPCGNAAPEKLLCKIPQSERMQSLLSSQLGSAMKAMKTKVSKLPPVQNLLCVEYGKNAQTCAEVKTMKKLMELSSSVCQVRINGSPVGSGFLLFDKFVLTNGHVLKGIYDEAGGQLVERVTVNFSHESLDQMDSEQESGGDVEVKEVPGFEYGPDESGHMYDWALLKLSANQKLLTHIRFFLHSGGVCIIGHPDGGVKKIDVCLVIPPDNRHQVVEKKYSETPGHIQLVTRHFFQGVAELVQRNRQVLTYESCFYNGSSGSPVFDQHCKVTAMHSGGYVYPDKKDETQSVIEFGYRMSDILEHIIVQLVRRGRFDVLKAYLAHSYTHHQDLISNVKKLVESRNDTAFKNRVIRSVHTDDENLKRFFEFFCQKEEPVLMDISSVYANRNN